MKKILFLMVLFTAFAFSQDSFEKFLQKDSISYRKYEIEFENKYQQYLEEERSGLENFIKETAKIWGESDVKLSDRTNWVEYDKSKTIRTTVDFNKNIAKVEIILDKKTVDNNDKVKEAIRNAVENLVKAKGNTRDYDIPLEKSKPLSKNPILKDQLILNNGKIVSPTNGKKFAKELIEKQKVEKETVQKDSSKIKIFISFPLAPNATRTRAESLAPIVKIYAEEYSVLPELVMAVIHTESSFNPKAQSHVPAYGLMQLVPKSGALDAYRFVYKKDILLTANELYNPERNIELGCAYLHILGTRYLKDISHATSRLYCTIAGYNTGTGNVSKTFSGNTSVKEAAKIINDRTPAQVYNYLKNNLPYDETKKYLERVTERMKLYR